MVDVATPCESLSTSTISLKTDTVLGMVELSHGDNLGKSTHKHPSTMNCVWVSLELYSFRCTVETIDSTIRRECGVLEFLTEG